MVSLEGHAEGRHLSRSYPAFTVFFMFEQS